MEMRRLTGDESALWFVWQKQESNNWSFTASELACLFCFIEHVKAQGSQNITIYHPSKNMPSWQRNQNTTYYKDSKLSLDEWRMQKQKCAHQVPTLFWNWATTIYTETNQHFTDTAIKLKRLSFLDLQPLFVKTWRRISKVTENYCNLYCCIYWFLYLFMGWVISSIIKLHWYQIAPIMT